jgi:hypothetical protein
MGQQHPQFLAAQRLDMHRAIHSHPHHLSDAARVIAIGLVDLAFSTACMCRVSTQIAGNSASARALNSHCSPIRLKR